MAGLWRRFKMKINKALENMAKQNQKTFGTSQGLDCCRLNKNQNSSK